jgi:hypothetical protein
MFAPIDTTTSFLPQGGIPEVLFFSHFRAAGPAGELRAPAIVRHVPKGTPVFFEWQELVVKHFE